MDVLKNILLFPGCFVFTTLSVYLMLPEYLHAAVTNRDLVTPMLATTLFALFIYLYDQSYLQNFPNERRLVYACFCISLCALGSTEIWLILKYILPYRGMLLSTALGLATGLSIFMIILNYMDGPSSDEDETPDPDEEEEIFIDNVMKSTDASGSDEIHDHQENVVIISITDQDLLLLNSPQLNQEQSSE